MLPQCNPEFIPVCEPEKGKRDVTGRSRFNGSMTPCLEVSSRYVTMVQTWLTMGKYESKRSRQHSALLRPWPRGVTCQRRGRGSPRPLLVEAGQMGRDTGSSRSARTRSQLLLRAGRRPGRRRAQRRGPRSAAARRTRPRRTRSGKRKSLRRRRDFRRRRP